MKKLFSVFTLVLFMSSNLNARIAVVEVQGCSDIASIAANNYCCENYGEDYTYSQYQSAYGVFMLGCHNY